MNPFARVALVCAVLGVGLQCGGRSVHSTGHHDDSSGGNGVTGATAGAAGRGGSDPLGGRSGTGGAVGATGGVAADGGTAGTSGAAPTGGTGAIPESGSLVWSKTFEGSFSLGGLAVSAEDGRIALVGSLRGSVDFGGGSLTSALHEDVVVACFEADGSHVYSRVFGDADTQYGQDIAFGPDGNVVLVGMFRGTLSFGGSNLVTGERFEAFLAKLDRRGNHVFSRQFGSGDTARDTGASGVAVNDAGDIAIAAHGFAPAVFGSAPPGDLASFTEDGELRWVTSGTSVGFVAFDSGGGVVGAGETGLDLLLVEFDGSGDEGYRVTLDAGNREQAYDIAVDASDSALAVGETSRSSGFDGTPGVASDIILAKVHSSGVLAWQKQWGDASEQVASSVAFDSAGNAFFVASVQGTIDIGLGPVSGGSTSDLFVAKLDPNGMPLWAHRYRRPTIGGNDRIAVDTTGSAIVAGQGVLELDGSVSEVTVVPMFLLRFAP